MDFTYSTEHVEACWKRWWLVAHLFKEIVEEMACLFVFFFRLIYFCCEVPVLVDQKAGKTPISQHAGGRRAPVHRVKIMN